MEYNNVNYSIVDILIMHILLIVVFHAVLFIEPEEGF